MAPESTEAKVSVLESQVSDLRQDASDYHVFKEAVITQLAALQGDMKKINWTVSGIMGAVILLGNLLIQWGFHKVLP